jgi:dATP pyrophosphohydrolase
MSFKQPRSVQVVIFSASDRGFEFLLLRRVAAHGGFWQSVTGSLVEGETDAWAAVREVFEETGIFREERELIDLGLVNKFEIAPQWRARYAPGVTHNEEVCFALKVDKCDVRLDQLEHEDYQWAGFDKAMSLLYWESSKRAFARLARVLELGSVASDA